MKIILEQISRRFNREWIFKNIDYSFDAGKSYAILGINGSGKSTLLQVISGSLSPSSGQLIYQLEGKEIPVEQVFKHLSIAAPYLELIEEFTLFEILDFHFQFKVRLNNLANEQLIKLLDMENSATKQIKYFSSGMKQRVKLVLALCSDTPILLLDEPTSNLDEQGIEWYISLINQFANNRLVIVCSNQAHEYEFCDYQLKLSNFKN
ncbi:MAG: ABC transporter ATP-binding protein [Bacteroidetes bacterium]|nr:ABC transporter ATP-binding protein [Bacteroidota bacterium]MBU1374169.1 ABC transporter ATP-binding protein [Bacteroidota bacterium]MBU1484718.1 ABC transporter ATP-binding protein [Bacteroidota bacterium]MBU1761527.1 ABC transporter ATP-binding protein [Bacteroidota bacterium]MBU2267299.1 ABC transporter ATP-binding protein [Bacteroidota bacterium]